MAQGGGAGQTRHACEPMHNRPGCYALGAMEKVNLNDVVRLARMSEDELSALIGRLEYYPADAPARSPLPRDLMLLDIAINLRAIALKGGPVGAEEQWLELANRPELREPAAFVNEISQSSMALGLRVRR